MRCAEKKGLENALEMARVNELWSGHPRLEVLTLSVSRCGNTSNLNHIKCQCTTLKTVLRHSISANHTQRRKNRALSARKKRRKHYGSSEMARFEGLVSGNPRLES